MIGRIIKDKGTIKISPAARIPRNIIRVDHVGMHKDPVKTDCFSLCGHPIVEYKSHLFPKNSNYPSPSLLLQLKTTFYLTCREHSASEK